jgi:hypothetical protein
MANRVEQLKEVQHEACELFAKKNADYGDAFANYGPIGVLVRMGDKLARLQSVTKNGIRLVDDSLIDLHNYSAMAIMLLDESENTATEPDPPLHIDEDMLKDVMYGQAIESRTGALRLDEVSMSVHGIVCGGRLDLETCKTLVAAVIDTYVERDVASAYLAVALRLAHEGQNILDLDAALRAREPLEDAPTPGSDGNNILIAEAGVGAITSEDLGGA